MSNFRRVVRLGCVKRESVFWAMAEAFVISASLRHPWKTIGCCTLLVLTVGSFMRFVAPSVSYKDMLGADHPKLIEYESLQSEYTRDDNLLLFIEALAGDAFTENILSGARELTNQLWQTPYSIRVDSVTNFQHSIAEGDDLLVEDLVPETSALDASELARIRSVALNEPLLLNRGTNEKGNVLGLSVKFAFPNEDVSEKLDAAAFVYDLADAFQKEHPGTKTYVGGLVALDATVMQISQEEMGRFLSAVVLLVLLMMMLVLRAVVPVVVSLLVFAFTIVSAMAFSGMMGWKLTPFTASVPMIVLILAVADCIHLITSYVQELRSGSSKRDAMATALRLNFRPIALTSTTTAIGFLTLNFSSSESVAALGNQVAFGVVVAMFLSLAFLPAMVALLPAKLPKPGATVRQRDYSKIVAALYRHRFGLLFLSLLVVGGLSFWIQKNEFNDEVPKYFSESLPWRQANDFTEREFGGAYTFAYSLDSGETNGVTKPEFQRTVSRFTDWLREQPEAVYVNSITDTMKRLNRNMHGEDAVFYKIPDDAELAAQYLLLYEMSLPMGLDLNDQVNYDKSAVRVQAVFETLSTIQVLEMEERIGNWLAVNTSQYASRGAGVMLMFAHMMSRDVKALVLGTVLGLVVISLFLIIGYRSIRLGLLSIAPNLFPVLMAFGVWGIFVGQVGMGMAMVSGITIGIVVDDTIHFMSKYLVGKGAHGLDAKGAVAFAYSKVGKSIVVTTCALVAGFLVMATQADFRVNSDMGKMTILVLGFALLFDLIVLPVLLMTFDRTRGGVADSLDGASSEAPLRYVDSK